MANNLGHGFPEKDCVTIHYGDDHTLSVSKDSCDFFVDGQAGKFETTICRDLFLCIIQRSPLMATPDDFIKAVGACQHAKYICMTRKRLKQAGLQIEVIECARNRGYKLSSGWELHDVRRGVIGAALAQIDRVVESTRSHVHHGALSESHMGLTFLERSPATQAHAHQGYMLLFDSGWQLVHELSRLNLTEDYAPDIIEVKKLIERLSSYATFMRIGHRLSHEDWRKDFMAEMQNIHTRLNQDVTRLHKASRK
jgi:hypothetical protein